MSEYLLSNAWEREEERLSDLEASWDPGTVLLLDEIGVAPGWRCLEAGGGHGSIARWLARRVGPTGTVVATDIDTRFLEQIDEPALEVRRHDLINDALEEDSFDLIHTRLLLEHLAERDQAMKKLVAALKPGGWLVVEDYDWAFTFPDESEPAYDRAIEACLKMVTAAGYDPYYGRKLPKVLLSHGLTDVTADGRVLYLQNGRTGATHWRLSLEQWGPRLVDFNLLTQPELDEMLSLWERPDFAAFTFMMVAARGRMPS